MDIIDSEDCGRANIILQEEAEISLTFKLTVAPFAASQIQRWVRGMLTRKRVRLRRKRRVLAALVLQRVGRGYLSRSFFAVVEPIASHALCRIVIKNSRRVGHLESLRCAAARALLRFLKSASSRKICHDLRDQKMFVQTMATRIQTRFRCFSVRLKYGQALLESKRARHEKALQQYLKQAVSGQLLERMIHHNQEKTFERCVCQLIIEQRCTFQVAVSTAQGIFSDRLTKKNSTELNREQSYATYCNNRQIYGLDKELTSDSDDDSIDEELLQPSQKAVALVKRRRNRKSASITDAASNIESKPKTNKRLLPKNQSKTANKIKMSQVVDRLMYNY